MSSNRLRQILDNNEFAMGSFLQFPSEEVVEIMGYAGFDFVIQDLEHTTYDTGTMATLTRTAKSVNLPSLVRMWGVDPALIIRVLDIGVEGLHFPRISSPEEAQAIVEYARTAPKGKRGVCPETRAGGYLSVPLEEYERLCNDVVLGVMIETVEGLENVEKILAVPGIDMVQVGPYDLAFSMGLATEGVSVADVTNSPEMLAAVERVIKAAEDNGVHVMQFTNSVENIGEKLEKHSNHRMFWYLTDGMIIMDAFQRVSDSVASKGFRNIR